MRQDSEEKKKKDEEKENTSKNIEKTNIVELADKLKSTDSISQNENIMAQQVTNIKEQKNSEINNQTKTEVDNSEKVKSENEDNSIFFDNIKKFEDHQKLINNKSSPATRKQLGINEKRKSAPVKPEMIEDLSKVIYKQSSLEDK